MYIFHVFQDFRFYGFFFRYIYFLLSTLLDRLEWSH